MRAVFILSDSESIWVSSDKFSPVSSPVSSPVQERIIRKYLQEGLLQVGYIYIFKLSDALGKVSKKNLKNSGIFH